jgi:hypothetical protein
MKQLNSRFEFLYNLDDSVLLAAANIVLTKTAVKLFKKIKKTIDYHVYKQLNSKIYICSKNEMYVNPYICIIYTNDLYVTLSFGCVYSTDTFSHTLFDKYYTRCLELQRSLTINKILKNGKI